MANLKQNNDMAVSPIVATLVLIVVAVIGAVAVGTIMGTFSTDVSKQAQTGQVSSASNTEILVAGSTTVQPASILLAQDYEKLHQGIQIDVQGGGSGAGIAAAGQGIADVGASSSALTAANLATYPNLQSYQIGARAVVWIVNSHSLATTTNAAELLKFVQKTGAIAGDGVAGLFVEEVTPAPDCGRLLVCVLVPAGCSVADAISALRRDAPRIRSEVAMAITRKRAPELLFVPAVPDGGNDE